MIVVDSSALMAVVGREPRALDCEARLAAESILVISAVTMAEAFVVAGRRGVDAEMVALIERLDFEIVPATAAIARRVAEAYARWGKGVHPAGLNFGDCFAYVTAKERNYPLLFIGDDFANTDVKAALS